MTIEAAFIEHRVWSDEVLSWIVWHPFAKTGKHFLLLWAEQPLYRSVWQEFQCVCLFFSHLHSNSKCTVMLSSGMFFFCEMLLNLLLEVEDMECCEWPKKKSECKCTMKMISLVKFVTEQNSLNVSQIQIHPLWFFLIAPIVGALAVSKFVF